MIYVIPIDRSIFKARELKRAKCIDMTLSFFFYNDRAASSCAIIAAVVSTTSTMTDIADIMSGQRYRGTSPVG